MRAGNLKIRGHAVGSEIDGMVYTVYGIVIKLYIFAFNLQLLLCRGPFPSSFVL